MGCGRICGLARGFGWFLGVCWCSEGSGLGGSGQVAFPGAEFGEGGPGLVQVDADGRVDDVPGGGSEDPVDRVSDGDRFEMADGGQELPRRQAGPAFQEPGDQQREETDREVRLDGRCARATMRIGP